MASFGSGLFINVVPNMGAFATRLREGVATSMQNVQATLPITANTEKFEQSVGNAVGRVQERFGRLLEYSVIGAGLDEGIRAVTKGVDEYGHLLQQQQQAKSLFGASAKEILDFSNKSVESLGKTNLEALQMTNQFGRLYEAGGASQKKAADQAKEIVQLIADLSGKTTLPQTRVEELIAAASKGTQRSLIQLKDLGIGITQEQLREEAIREGFGKVDKYKVADLQDRIKLLQDELAGKGTTEKTPRQIAEENEKVRIEQTKYYEAVQKYTANSIQAAEAQLALHKAEDARNSSAKGHLLTQDQVKAKQDEIAKLQHELTIQQKGTVDLQQDIEARENAFYTLLLGSEGAKAAKGAYETSPQTKFERAKAAIRQAEIDLGAGIFPVAARFATFLTDHVDDLGRIGENTGKVLGAIFNEIGNGISFVENHWGIIKPILEGIGAAFALDKIAHWGSTLVGFITQAGSGELFKRLLPDLYDATHHQWPGTTRAGGPNRTQRYARPTVAPIAREYPTLTPVPDRTIPPATIPTERTPRPTQEAFPTTLRTMNVTAELVNVYGRGGGPSGSGGALGGPRAPSGPVAPGGVEAAEKEAVAAREEARVAEARAQDAVLARQVEQRLAEQRLATARQVSTSLQQEADSARIAAQVAAERAENLSLAKLPSAIPARSVAKDKEAEAKAAQALSVKAAAAEEAVAREVAATQEATNAAITAAQNATFARQNAEQEATQRAINTARVKTTLAQQEEARARQLAEAQAAQDTAWYRQNVQAAQERTRIPAVVKTEEEQERPGFFTRVFRRHSAEERTVVAKERIAASAESEAALTEQEVADFAALRQSTIQKPGFLSRLLPTRTPTIVEESKPVPARPTPVEPPKTVTPAFPAGATTINAELVNLYARNLTGTGATVAGRGRAATNATTEGAASEEEALALGGIAASRGGFLARLKGFRPSAGGAGLGLAILNSLGVRPNLGLGLGDYNQAGPDNFGGPDQAVNSLVQLGSTFAYFNPITAPAALANQAAQFVTGGKAPDLTNLQSYYNVAHAVTGDFGESDLQNIAGEATSKGLTFGHGHTDMAAASQFLWGILANQFGDADPRLQEAIRSGNADEIGKLAEYLKQYGFSDSIYNAYHNLALSVAEDAKNAPEKLQNVKQLITDNLVNSTGSVLTDWYTSLGDGAHTAYVNSVETATRKQQEIGRVGIGGVIAGSSGITPSVSLEERARETIRLDRPFVVAPPIETFKPPSYKITTEPPSPTGLDTLSASEQDALKAMQDFNGELDKIPEKIRPILDILAPPLPTGPTRFEGRDQGVSPQGILADLRAISPGPPQAIPSVGADIGTGISEKIDKGLADGIKAAFTTTPEVIDSINKLGSAIRYGLLSPTGPLAGVRTDIGSIENAPKGPSPTDLLRLGRAIQPPNFVVQSTDSSDPFVGIRTKISSDFTSMSDQLVAVSKGINEDSSVTTKDISLTFQTMTSASESMANYAINLNSQFIQNLNKLSASFGSLLNVVPFVSHPTAASTAGAANIVKNVPALSGIASDTGSLFRPNPTAVPTRAAPAGDWFTSPTIVRIGDTTNSQEGEGVFNARQISALWRMGIDLGGQQGSSAPQVRDVHVYNPANEVDVLTAIMRYNDHMFLSEIRGVTPAPDYPANLRLRSSW